MSFVVHIQSEAQSEVERIRDHYDGLRSGLGERFIDAFDDCLAALEVNPNYQKRKSAYRHAMIPGFPYRVVFEVEADHVFVYQVRHTSRKPSKRFGP